MRDLLFPASAAIAVVSALLVVTRRNPIYSALFLILSFISIAVVFLELDAVFLAGLHVLVYTGAIMVLFLFVIMLLNLKPNEMGGEYRISTRAVLFVLCVALFLLLAVGILKEPSLERIPPVQDYGDIDRLGKSLFEDYALPFELMSVLILVAMFGGVVLAKRKLP